MSKECSRSDQDAPQHVVYVLGVNCEPTHFLEIVDGRDELKEALDKWMLAFDSGEKKPPGDYNGLSHRPVVGFGPWPEDDDG